MSENRNEKLTAGYAGGGALFGMLMSRVVSDALASYPHWIQITATAITAGVLAVVFVLVANRMSRPSK